jgi:hypothetical protein
MTRERFEQLLDELDGTSLQTLKQKNAKYSSPEDALHNFNEGSDIGGCTPAQTAWFYATKHLIALRDKILRNDFLDREDFLEKTQDIINYLRFIWCIGNEEIDKYTAEHTVDDISCSLADNNEDYSYLVEPILQSRPNAAAYCNLI